ncbi:hypothetical protein TcBrA4_0039850 [Trypanosoma cruzi]|nr:hypothetical protein TcBrA4_0039850 [Trypanosoma cruzi]
MDALTATGGGQCRARPATPGTISDGESVTTPKIEPQCTHAAKLKTQREEGQARTATLPPRETPSSAQEANAGGGRRTVPKAAHTSIHQRRTVADSTTAACRAAEKVHLARRRRHDGITTARILPSSMRLLALRQ